MRSSRIFELVTVLCCLTWIACSTGDGPLGSGTATGSVDFSTVCHEALRGDFVTGVPDFFAVSPDEAWVVRMVQVISGDSLEGDKVVLVHQPSGRMWERFFPAGEESEIRWRPDCFSEDSAELYIGRRTAELSPDMAELRFSEPAPRGTTPQGAHLGARDDVRGGGSETVWRGADASGAGGPTTRTIRYRAVPRDDTTVIRRDPPGDELEIDFSAVLEAENRARRETEDALRGARDELRKQSGLTAEQKEAFRELEEMLESEADTEQVKLKYLSVSPDRRTLAAIAEVSSDMKMLGSLYGVLVPLEEGERAARPFAQNVYGTLVWGGDRVYFYAQPVAGGGAGTVCYARLDPR